MRLLSYARARRGPGVWTSAQMVGRALLAGGGLILAACQTYTPAPVEPIQILDDLARVGLTDEASGRTATAGAAFDPQDGISMLEAAAFAVTHNLSLRQRRAEIGVASAQLVEAGLLPNPTASWDAMDWVVGGTSDDVLTGLGLLWEVPRPGEIGARKGVAKARVEEVRQQVLAGEWSLSRSVAIAWLQVLAARHRLKLNEQILTIARRTHDFLQRSRQARTATALQENLAGIELANMEADRRRLLVADRQARQALNALLGLRPGFKLELQSGDDVFAFREVETDPDAVVRDAIRNRPDLRALLLVYRQAEEALRLEIKRQFPRLAIGTGIAVEIPVSTKFNTPAICTARRERERVRRMVTAAVHDLRKEVHRTITDMERAADQIRYLQKNLSPRLAESLRISRESVAVTEITPLELLTAQRQVLESKTRLLELRIEHRKSRELVSTLDGSWGRPATAASEEESQ